MAEIIQFTPRLKDDPRFTARLDAAVAGLGEAALAIKDDLLNLAFLGPWREWNDKQPEGTDVEVSGDALANTGDPRITQLYALYEHMCDVISQLGTTQRMNSQPAKPHEP